uniref:Uncharacterized protein n=1 Tax=Arundo donax TaxID=35708 RepID=A0A0A9BNL5_ARUDO
MLYVVAFDFTYSHFECGQNSHFWYVSYLV